MPVKNCSGGYPGSPIRRGFLYAGSICRNAPMVVCVDSQTDPVPRSSGARASEQAIPASRIRSDTAASEQYRDPPNTPRLKRASWHCWRCAASIGSATGAAWDKTMASLDRSERGDAAFSEGRSSSRWGSCPAKNAEPCNCGSRTTGAGASVNLSPTHVIRTNPANAFVRAHFFRGC